MQFSAKLFKKKSTKNLTTSPYLQEPYRGVQLLWSHNMIKVYGSLLKNSSNGATLEASAGAIQNLSACYWEVCLSAYLSRIHNLSVCLPIYLPIYSSIAAL